jgi:hypothetical protein
MTYQQTLQNIHAAILSKKSTCDIRPDVIGLMRSEAGRDLLRLAHAFLPFSPKKAGPDHCVPVINLAMADKLL